jgi:hypothetical protein
MSTIAALVAGIVIAIWITAACGGLSAEQRQAATTEALQQQQAATAEALRQMQATADAAQRSQVASDALKALKKIEAATQVGSISRTMGLSSSMQRLRLMQRQINSQKVS